VAGSFFYVRTNTRHFVGAVLFSSGSKTAVSHPKNAPRPPGGGAQIAVCILKARDLRDRRGCSRLRRRAISAKSMPRPGRFSRSRCRIKRTLRRRHAA
jgi:hypothetical protein